jgi:hypothetical protein
MIFPKLQTEAQKDQQEHVHQSGLHTTLLTYILWPTGGVECRGQSMELQVVYFTALLINCLKKETAKHNHFPGPILLVPRKKLKPILLKLGKHLLVV